MSFDWNNIDQSSKLIDRHFFYPFYGRLNQFVQELPQISLAAPVIGVIDMIGSSVQAVSGVAEAILKGGGNILRAGPTRNAVLMKRGCLQLFLGGGVITLSSIPLIFCRTLRITKGMWSQPRETSETQAENYREKIGTTPNSTPLPGGEQLPTQMEGKN